MLLHGDIGRLEALTVVDDDQDIVTFIDGVAYRSSKAVIKGAEVVFTQEESSLGDGEEIDTGFIDFAEADKFQLTYQGDTLGLTYVQEEKMTLGGS